jgi:hypothetical protein
MSMADLRPQLQLRQSNALNARNAALRLVQIITIKNYDALINLSESDNSLVDLWLEELEAELAKSAKEQELLLAAVDKLRSVKADAPVVQTEESHLFDRVA